MKTRKTSLLKWLAMIELVIGAYNLMTGLMSAYVLLTDLDGVMASFAESGEIKKWLVPGAVLGLWAAAVWILSRPGGILHYNPLTAVTCRLTMAVGSWILISVLPLPGAKEYTKHSFFLYAIHFAWVRLFNKAGALMFPGSAGAALLFFFAMPFVMVPVSLGLGRLLGRVLPPGYRVLTGGR